MSTFRKDRNNLYITLDGKSGAYRLDLSTGIYYGIKGNPIKTAPAGELTRMFSHNEDNELGNLARVLYILFRDYGLSNTANIPRYLVYIQGAEKLDGLRTATSPNMSLWEYEWANENIGLVSKWIKENPNSALPYMYQIRDWAEWVKVKGKLGEGFELITAEMWQSMSNYNWSDNEKSVAAYYLGRGKLWEYDSNYACRRLNDYFTWCKFIKKTPDKVNNFMREYCETRKEYELRKVQYDIEKIAENYAKHSKAWEFEYGRYKIVVPTTPTDIIDEGRNMHHCVGGYVNSVVDNSCYIVFVRPIDNPNKCYITCEVRKNGTIGQYFLAHDRYIDNDEDKEFKTKFAEHLKEVWYNN